MKKGISILLAAVLLCSSAFAAYIQGNVSFWDGTPADGVSILAITSIMPFPFLATTDIVGDYSINIEPLPPAGDTIFVLCSPDSGYSSTPGYYNEYIVSSDTLTGLDFVLWPDSLPGFSLTVWAEDSLGDAINGVEVTCRFDGVGVPDQIDSTDFGGRCVFSISEEGDYFVTATYAGTFSVPEVETVFVDMSSPNPAVTFTMLDSSAASPYWIYIEAEDSLGAPVESLFVEWTEEDSAAWSPLWTDVDGLASLHLVRPGNYELRAAYPEPDCIVEPAETTISLTPSEPLDTVFFRLLPDTTGIRESRLPKSPNISVFPNPFNSACTIRISGEVTGLVEIAIFDVDGREILTAKPQTEWTWLPPKTLPSGVYLVQVTNGDRDASTIRVLYLK